MNHLLLCHVELLEASFRCLKEKKLQRQSLEEPQEWGNIMWKSAETFAAILSTSSMLGVYPQLLFPARFFKHR